MNPTSAAHIVFATPELAHIVFAFVPRRDLLRCLRVCREWHQHAEPLLWRHFRSGVFRNHKLPPEARKALIRNLPRIRSVELERYEWRILPQFTYRLKPDNSVKVASRLCTNLRRLKLDCRPIFPRLKPPLEVKLLHRNIVKLLHHNLLLTHLTLPFAALTLDSVIFAPIPNLKRLRHLTVNSVGRYFGAGYAHIGSPTIPLLLQACLPLPELTELFLDFDMIWQLDDNDTDTSDVESVIQAAATTRFSEHPTASKIKSLRLPTCHRGGRNPLPVSLLKSGLLDPESSTIPWFSEDTSPQDVEQTVREHCPHLRHVICPSLDKWKDGWFIRAFLQGCSGLQSFVSSSFSDQRQIHNNHGLLPSYESRLILSALSSCHHTTLETFELTECNQASSQDLQTILSRCTQLKRFWVAYSNEAGKPPGIDFTDLSRSDWVCMGLRELSLRLNRDLDGEDTLSPDQLAEASKRIYTQIGRLHQLEVLVLDIKGSEKGRRQTNHFSWDLTLSEGWLDEMADLKSLKKITLHSQHWSRMGPAEMRFMHDHWPLLRELRLDDNGKVFLNHAMRWQWPSEKRRPEAWYMGNVRVWTAIGPI